MEEIIKELDALSQEYLALKDEKTYYVMTLCERAKTFLNIAKDCEHSRAGIEKVDQIKALFFNEETFEKLGLSAVEHYFGTFKVADKYGKKIKYLVVINPDGFKKGISFDSNKNTYIFELSLKDHTVDRVSPHEVKKYFKSGAYELMKDGQKLDGVQLDESYIDMDDIVNEDDFISVDECFEDYMFDGLDADLEY